MWILTVPPLTFRWVFLSPNARKEGRREVYHCWIRQISNVIQMSSALLPFLLSQRSESVACTTDKGNEENCQRKTVDGFSIWIIYCNTWLNEGNKTKRSREAPLLLANYFQWRHNHMLLSVERPVSRFGLWSFSGIQHQMEIFHVTTKRLQHSFESC